MDLNDDGRLDLISGCYPGEIYYFKRKPNRTFAAPVTLQHASGGIINVGRASAADVADWDDDGDLDLVIGTIDGKVHFVPNESKGRAPAFGQASVLEAGGAVITAAGGDAGPCIADWDGDGKHDLLVGHGNGDLTWHRNVGSKRQPRLASGEILIKAKSREDVSAAEFDNPKVPGMRLKPCVADWNGDGRMDLLVGDFSFRRAGDRSEYHGWVWVYLRQNPELGAVQR